jgi:O-antigen/teichoic acid export membrane protein
MGIIKRQSIKGIGVFIIGAGIHFFTMLILMPNILPEADQAVYRVYAALIILFASIGIAGVNGSILKYIPEVEHQHKQRNTYNTLTLLYTTLCAIITVLAIYTCKNIIYSWKGTQSPYLLHYFWCIPVSVFFYIYLFYFEYYSIATHRVTVPSLVKEIFIRGMLLINILLVYLGKIDVAQFFTIYTITYAVAAIVLALYCIVIRGYRLSYYTTELANIDIKSHWPTIRFFLIISAIGTSIANIDQPLIYGLLGPQSTDIYGLAVTTASMITIPYKPLANLLMPFLYAAWRDKDYNKLNDINQQSSINLTALGCLLIILMIANTTNLLHYLPEVYTRFKWPLIIIGFSRILDYTTGVSTEILATAPNHKNLIYYTLISFIASLISYVVLIPHLHEVGAAIAFSIGYIAFNTCKYIDLYKNYKLQPLQLKSIYCIILAIAIIGLQQLIPNLAHPILDLIIRSTILSIVFIAIIFKLHWVPLLNEFGHKYLRRKSI